MPDPQPHRFDHLRHDDGIFILRVQGPRNGSHTIRLNTLDMARMMDDYQTIMDALSRTAMQPSPAELKQAEYVGGIPIMVVISHYYGITVEEAEGYWNRTRAEAHKTRSQLLREQLSALPGPLEWTDEHDGLW